MGYEYIRCFSCNKILIEIRWYYGESPEIEQKEHHIYCEDCKKKINNK